MNDVVERSLASHKDAPSRNDKKKYLYLYISFKTFFFAHSKNGTAPPVALYYCYPKSKLTGDPKIVVSSRNRFWINVGFFAGLFFEYIIAKNMCNCGLLCFVICQYQYVCTKTRRLCRVTKHVISWKTRRPFSRFGIFFNKIL